MNAPRPFCLKPDACLAKRETTCKHCCAVKNMNLINADPERVARRRELSAAARDTPEFKQALSERVKGYWKKASYRKAQANNGRRKLALWKNDETIELRRREGMRKALAVKTAKKVLIPLELVEEFRRLRSRKFSIDEARAVLRQSHSTAFAVYDSAEREREALEQANRRRAAGPEPALHTPQRREWIRRIGELV